MKCNEIDKYRLLQKIEDDSVNRPTSMNVDNVKDQLIYEIINLVNKVHNHFDELCYNDDEIERILSDVYFDVHTAIRLTNNHYSEMLE